MVTKTTNPNTILLGNTAIKEIKSKMTELDKLKSQFPKLFDDKPNAGYGGYECKIITPSNRRVNIKYRKIPQALQDGADRV